MPSERSTGFVFAAVAAVVAALWRENTVVLYTAGAVSCAFAVLALVVPRILRPLNIVWFKFALLLNKVVSPIVMFVLFVVVIVPFGAILRLQGDPLRKQRRDDAPTFWITREIDGEESSMTNQF